MVVVVKAVHALDAIISNKELRSLEFEVLIKLKQAFDIVK